MEPLQLTKLNRNFDALQKKYGDKNLDAIYGAGCTSQPDVCFIFMNPTGKNVSASKSWAGLKAPWLGTKNIWKLFYFVNLLDKQIFEQTQTNKPSDWDYKFANRLYQEVSNKKYYITNLSKATQTDARPLPNAVFKQYLDLMFKELSHIQPKIIISFGNQVSSILLNKNIMTSKNRKKKFELHIKSNTFKTYPVYYPVGQGLRNINKSISDIKWILSNNNIITKPN